MELLDQTDSIVASNQGGDCKDTMKVVNPKLWWPYTSAPSGESAGYLHNLVVTVIAQLEDRDVADIYRSVYHSSMFCEGPTSTQV